MQQRYNIVLIPSLIKDREKFINFAQQFATEHLIELQGYLLGTNSIPHITLCQFEGSEKELEKIKNALQTLVCSDEGYAPNFNIFNGKIILGGNLAGKEAVDLGVEKTSEIVRLHTEINNIVKKIGLTPLNASGDLYRPHLTLAFFKPQEVPVPETISLEQFNGINFTVALGKADDNWQFTEILTTQKDLSLSTANILVKYFGYTQKQAEDFLDVSIKMQVGLDPFLKGEVFNGKYSLEEQESICREMVVIVQDQFAKKTTTAEKFYTSSAGAPGTGKTFFLETKCNAVDPQSNVIYVDPDRSTLPKLSMYTQYCKEKGFKDAYNKCRDGSNYMANFMLIKAIMEGLNIIHGTTASSERIINIYAYLTEIGYKINIELFFANDKNRGMAINFREQSSGQAQVTQEDMAGKLAPIFYRMCDSYFKYADKINIFFQPDHFWLGLAEMESLAWIGRYSKDTGVVELFQNNEKFMKYLETEMEKVFLPKDQIKSLLQKFESIKPEPELLLSQYVASSSNQPPEQADKVIDKENTPTKRIGF